MGRSRPAHFGGRWLEGVGALALLLGLLFPVAAASVASVASAAAAVPVAATASSAGSIPGYWILAADGGVYQFNTANFGSLRGHPLNRPIVGGTAGPGGLGYWLVASDGGVFPFGSAHFYGSTGNIRLNQPIVGMAATPDGKGYWLVASDGGIFPFGDAHFYGSTGNIRLNQPVVGMAADGSSGYWLVARDGGIFHFGAARFYGSTGNIRLNQPVVGMAADGSSGYWLVARDGGIFHFGAAPFYGSTGNIRLNQPVVGMAADGSSGYWLVARDGGIFDFGHAPFLGSTGSNPVVALAATTSGFPFPPGGIGYDVSNYQCGRPLPTGQAFGVVQISDGYIDSPGANPCYVAEARWAGANMSAYIFMNGLPSPPPAESQRGPAGTCNGNVSCESYNFGWFWAVHWVAYSRSVGVDPPLWWLDVELGGFNLGGAYTASNDRVISGAIAGLQASGVLPGVYSTSYQWGQIAGSGLYYPGMPLWIPGAGPVSGPGYTATNYCASAGWAPRFAGGVAVLVQFGYGLSYPVDPDYACR